MEGVLLTTLTDTECTSKPARQRRMNLHGNKQLFDEDDFHDQKICDLTAAIQTLVVEASIINHFCKGQIQKFCTANTICM